MRRSKVLTTVVILSFTIEGIAILALSEQFWSGVIIALIGSAGAAIVAWLNRRGDKTVKDQLKPNGGATLRDAIDRIDRATADTGERLATMEDRMNTLDRAMVNHTEHVITLNEGAIKVVEKVDRLRVDMDSVRRDVKTLAVRVTVQEQKEQELAADDEAEELRSTNDSATT